MHRKDRTNIENDLRQARSDDSSLVLADAARIQLVSFYTFTYFLPLSTPPSEILSNQAKTSLFLHPKAFPMIGLKVPSPAAQALTCPNYTPERLDLNIKLLNFFTIHALRRNDVKRKVKRGARSGLVFTGCLSRCPARQTRNRFHLQPSKISSV